MRVTLFALLLTAAGCAGQPASAPPVAAVATVAPVASVASSPPVAVMAPAAPASPPVAPATTMEERIAEAKRMGYKLRSQDGEEYFCRTELKTGSRVARETVCLTAKDIDSLRQQTQEGLANGARQVMQRPNH